MRTRVNVFSWRTTLVVKVLSSGARAKAGRKPGTIYDTGIITYASQCSAGQM
jgi:hypothetical protein